MTLQRAWVYPNEIYTAKIMNLPVEYSHMHINYGMWGQSDKDDMPLDLGIGFVTMLEGQDKTPAASMPTTGDAVYQGGWVATVKGAGENGRFTNYTGLSKVTADFAKNTVGVDLMDLATFSSTLDEGMRNRFSKGNVTKVEALGGLTAATAGPSLPTSLRHRLPLE